MKYRILFSDDTPPREFDDTNINAVLEWAHGLENNTVLSIETPHFTLSVLTKEDYEKAMQAFDLSVV